MDIIGLDPALGIEAEFKAALEKAKANGVRLVGVLRGHDGGKYHEARFVRSKPTGVDNKDYFTANRPDDCSQPAGEWLTEMTDEAIKALAAS